MRTFYFNSGVKPWNTNFQWQIEKGNKFINNELHHPFQVSDEVPEGARLKCLMDKPHEHYSTDHYISVEVLGGNMCSKYAVFHK